MYVAIIQLIFIGMALTVFVGTLLFQVWGQRYARSRPDRPAGITGQGSAAIEASVFALLGLLVAFSFSGSESRLQSRRDLTVAEIDAIGTAYLRLDLLPQPARASIKAQMRQYVDERIAFYKDISDLPVARAHRARAERLQRTIWAASVEATARTPDTRAALLVLPSLNQSFDAATARDAALRMHIPIVIFIFLGLLAFGCAFLAGMDMAAAEQKSALHVFVFAITMAITAYVVLNIEFPLAGFLRLESLTGLFADLRSALH